jgi:hypothetical protein
MLGKLGLGLRSANISCEMEYSNIVKPETESKKRTDMKFPELCQLFYFLQKSDILREGKWFFAALRTIVC